MTLGEIVRKSRFPLQEKGSNFVQYPQIVWRNLFIKSVNYPNMSIYDGLKDAARVLQEVGKIEQYKQILEAQEKMLEMQKKITDLEYENKELKDKLDIKGI